MTARWPGKRSPAAPLISGRTWAFSPPSVPLRPTWRPWTVTRWLLSHIKQQLSFQHSAVPRPLGHSPHSMAQQSDPSYEVPFF